MKDNDSTAVKIFISSSHRDTDLRKILRVHLAVLEKQGFIRLWDDDKIIPGEKWEQRIEKELKDSDIVLLLISPDFLASDFIEQKEIKRALELSEKGKIDAIPVILKPCDWEEKKALARLQVLPERGKPIDSKYWHSRDEAFTEVVRGLKIVIRERIKIKEKEKEDKIEILKRGDKQIQVPGGPLHPDVINYIERPADRQLNALLEFAYAPMFLIIGGIQCGKTSLIYRFLKNAREKIDKKVIHIDFKKLTLSGKHLSIKDVFIRIFERCCEDLHIPKPGRSVLENDWDDSAIALWATDRLKRLLESYLENADNADVFLIFDSVDLLYDHLSQPAQIDALVHWLGMLRNLQDDPPFNHLTIITTMTVLSYSAAPGSPLRTQAANIVLPNFGQAEIIKLLEIFGIETNKEKIAEKIFNLFGGHPHLSHLAVSNLFSGIKFSEIKDKAYNLIGGYGVYWDKILRTLKYVLKRKEEKVENDIIKVLNALAADEKDKEQNRIIGAFFENLYFLGLIQMNHQVASDFIKKAIELAQMVTEKKI
jgi:hypothetical protein